MNTLHSSHSSAAVNRAARTLGLNVALTGGPSVGKTTMTKWLESVGFVVLPEMASVIIQAAKSGLRSKGLELSNHPQVVEYFKQAGLFHPMVDNPAFQNELFTRQLAQEQPHVDGTTPGLVCFDRTYLDGFVYCKHYGVDVPERFFKTEPVPSQRYDLCFLLESLNTFEDNGLRVENTAAGVDFAKMIGPLLGDIYRQHGVPVISVPALSIDGRKDFMWKHIEELAQKKLAQNQAA